MGKKKTREDIWEAAHEVWLAGLGAVSSAEDGSYKLFESLVAKGKEFEKGPLKKARKKVKSTVEELRSQAGKAVDSLESSVEGQVAKALKRIGVATKDDVKALQAKVKKLENELASERRGKSPATRKKPAAKKVKKKATR